MLSWTSSMVAEGDGELYYVIAVLIFGVVGAIAEKIKKAGKNKGQQPRPRPPQPIRRDRPAAPPTRPRAPQPRPTSRDARPQRPVAPPVAPARRSAARPPSRPPAPPARSPAEPRRRMVVDVPKPARPAARPPQARPVAKQAMPAQADQAAERPRAVPRVETHVRRAAPAGQLAPAGRRGIGSFEQVSRSEVRRAIILSEIFRPPLALREEVRYWEM